MYCIGVFLIFYYKNYIVYYRISFCVFIEKSMGVFLTTRTILFITMFTVYILVCSLRKVCIYQGMYIPSFVLIGCFVSE